MNPIEASARAALKPKDRRPPWQWIEENVGIRNSPFGNRPNFSRTPWLKKPSEKFADNRIRAVSMQCCVQGSKTFFMGTHGIWALSQDPGPLGYYVQTDNFVTKFAQGRWLPMVKESPLKDMLQDGNRFAIGKAEIYFKNTFALVMSANESNTQSVSLRYVFCDDGFIWSPGMMKAAHERATRWWNRKIINGSAAQEKNSEGEFGDSDKNFESGTKDEWRLMCPGCRKLQIPDIEKHLKWPTNELTKPQGRWNFEAVKKAVRLRCEHCGTELPNTPETLRLMNEGGDYLTTNPNAPADNFSCRWNSLCLDPSEFSWGDLAVEWIHAARAWKAGVTLPMKDLKTKRLGVTFDPRSVNPFASLPVVEIVSSKAPDKSPYPKLFWPLQDFILMGVDVQIDHFWFLIMAWSKAGDECALEAGKLFNWSDIEEKQKEYGVLHEDVGVDVSHRWQEVVRECARRGRIVGNAWRSWTAYRGSDLFQFTYEKRDANGKVVSRTPLPYAWPPQIGNPVQGLRSDNPLRKELQGRRVPIITWSNPSIKDIVFARRDGKVEATVETLKGEWNAEYARQMHSQKKIAFQPKYGPSKWRYENFTDDHILDCRCECTVRAIRRGLIADVMATE